MVEDWRLKEVRFDNSLKKSFCERQQTEKWTGAALWTFVEMNFAKNLGKYGSAMEVQRYDKEGSLVSCTRSLEIYSFEYIYV